MEALSGISSAFAIASLAIQAADSVKKLSKFWDSVQDAPQSVSDIIEDLGIVSNALEDIAYEANSARPHSRSLELSLSSLHICSDKVQRLQNLLEELSFGLSAPKRRKRTWASFKAAWIQDKIAKFQDSVRDLKTTLVITRQTAISRLIIANQESQQLELALIADGIKSLLKQHTRRTVTTVSEHNLDLKQHVADLRKEIDNLASSHVDSMSTLGMGKSMDLAISQLSKRVGNPFHCDSADQELSLELKKSKARGQGRSAPFSSTTSVTNTQTYRYSITCIFGIVQVTSATSRIITSDYQNESSDQYCTRTSLILHPSRLLQICGLNFGLRISFSNFGGFDCQIHSYQAVPDNAAIFRFCKNGDIKGIQGLLEGRLASPRDTNSKGLTPLFFAAQFGHVEVCKLLIAEGADVEAQNFMKDSVASYACLRASDNTTSTSCSDHIQTLRLFLNYLEFDEDMNCSGLTGLRRLITKRCSDPNCQHPALHPATLYWAFPIVKTQFSRHIPSIDRTVAHLWRISILEKDHEALKRLIMLVENAHFQRILKWFSPVHFVIWYIHEHVPSRRESLRVLITNGLDLHYLADDRLSANLNYNMIRGDTPASLAMRFSLTFFHFRDILFQCSTQLSTFIERELQQGPLADLGWTPSNLQRLFELDFRPVEMPAFTCTGCKYPSRSSTEEAWQILLKKIIEGEDRINAIKEFEQAEKVSTEDLKGICWYCNSQGIVPEQENLAEDSTFLLSI